MGDFLAAAERLRLVRRARGEFLERWVVENLIVGPMLLDRLARALAGCGDQTAALLQPAPGCDEETRSPGRKPRPPRIPG